ncbi:MAG: alpha/beta fold hydrolase [bacterium]|nr:alpha/beta fold hydrolase [bacterium]
MKNEFTGRGIAYLHEGSGRPLVFIHGWSMAAPLWQRQIEHFAKSGYEATAIDLRGHGKSFKDGPYTISQFAYDLKDFIHDRGLEKPVLVGWSMGAMVALEFIIKHPSKAAGICLVGGMPRFTEADDYPHGLPLKDVKGMKVKLKRDFERTMGEFRESISEGLSESDKEILMNAAFPDLKASKASLVELMEDDLREGLEKIKLPTLLIHGDKDRVSLRAASEYMLERISGSRLALIKGAGHVPFLSHKDEFNETLEEFLRRI